MTTSTTDVATAPSPSPFEAFIQYFRDFAVLKETRKEYWGIQIINFVDCTAYFALLTIASVFLSEDIGMSDTHAGWVITGFTSATSIFLLFSGAVTDSLGIRKSLHLNFIGSFLLRLGVVLVAMSPELPYRGYIIAALLLCMAPFMAGIQTMFQSACKRFTTKKSRGAGFNVWYLFMNIGAACAGFSIDIIRKALELPSVHVFTMGTVCALICYLVGYVMVRNDAQLLGEDEEPEPEVKAEKQSPWDVLKAVFSDSAIWRLLTLVAMILGVRAVFVYLYILMPKYWLRTIGPDAAFGTLNAINPIGIVIGLVLVIPLANKFKVYSMLVYGALISALALIPMAIPWEYYGMSIANAHYTMALLAMVILTVGEVIWSPKLYEYTASIAPKGQEGVYLGFSLVPWFLAKTVVSYFSGTMLGRWAPEQVTVEGVTMPLQQAMIEGQLSYWDRPEAMWLILGGWAIAGCVIAIFLKGWMTKGTDS